MAGLSISTAWDETAAFVGREGSLLFPVGFVFLALPSVIVGLLMPEAIDSAKTYPEMMAIIRPLLPQIMAAFAVATLVTLVGSLALYALCLRPGGTSVGEALRLALSRFAVALAATLLLLLAWSVLFSIPFTLGAAGAGHAMGLAFLLLIPLAVFAGIRLMLLSAVIMGEAGGPLDAIRRSWALTRGHFWKLFGFVIVVAIVVVVVSIVGNMLLGFIDLALGEGRNGVVSTIGGALLNTVINVYMLVMSARIYRQLAGGLIVAPS